VRGIDTYQPRTGTTSGVVDNSETVRPFATGRTPAAVANIANLNYSCA
jgi:tyrosinase